MFCTQCGSPVEPHARFCSKCGQQVTVASVSSTPPAPTPKRTEHDMNMHVNILGWLLIGSGILTAIGGTIVLFASQIFRHMPPAMAHEMPMGVPPFVAWLTSVVGLAIIAVARSEERRVGKGWREG